MIGNKKGSSVLAELPKGITKPEDILKVIFNFALNNTSTIQSFITRDGNPIAVHPYQALETLQIHGDFSDILTPIDSFLNHLDKKKIKRFCIIRTYALGDILMLVPVIRALRKQGYDPFLRTVNEWRPILDLLDIEMEDKRHTFRFVDWGVNLDGTLEQDHFRPILSEIHRVEIYFIALGIKKMPKKLDWGLDLEKLPKVDIEGDYICFQGAGSTKMKKLPSESINYIKERFKEKGINVVMIGEGNKKSARRLFAIIKGAKCLICMDSAPLWISHFTKTPVIALLGPTRASERLSKHPLYPDRAVGIALNKEIDCENCFESTKKCNGEVDCLKVRPERIWELIYPEVEKWL